MPLLKIRTSYLLSQRTQPKDGILDNGISVKYLKKGLSVEEVYNDIVCTARSMYIVDMEKSTDDTPNHLQPDNIYKMRGLNPIRGVLFRDDHRLKMQNDRMTKDIGE
jgi:hypothetical protein